VTIAFERQAHRFTHVLFVVQDEYACHDPAPVPCANSALLPQMKRTT
jgi:hypothetical protein